MFDVLKVDRNFEWITFRISDVKYYLVDLDLIK